MKITVKGDPKKQKIARGFRCEGCGCLFEAETQEYQRVNIGNAVFLRTECPWCLREVMQEETEIGIR